MANATSAGQPLAGLSPDEFVRALSDEQKDAVLGSLLREAVRVNGATAVIAVDDRAGHSLGYFVPPAAAAHCFKVVPPPLTDERESAIRRALATPGDTFDASAFLGDINPDDPD
ncbi:MAG: hypothetical protein K2V38_00455 [Gemmataceae bacterium]|nr:hypothetical protein [Gemmataceae bacterium]